MADQSVRLPVSHSHLSQAQMCRDEEVTANRSASTTITEPKDFSLMEKVSFNDLLQEWCAARPNSGDNSQVLTAKLRESFFERFFYLWDSTDDMVVMPTLHEKNIRETAEFVRFKDGITKAKAIESAIVNWDKYERARVDKFNSDLIIALARMRIVQFAQDGTESPPTIPQELRINGRTLKCQLISDDFEEHYNIVKAVHNGLKARKIGRPHHIII
ncbi:hypothetical protein FGADI_2599 [Fusarium gaditjirri]|uniref:Uncharacterized protein n=1 Tax=Fusarium gaditjirri TaxID=282569 RepID=A0A8H4TIB1_9HYPO|nr:hypothetical protein FGADI_2599 [Fusarium gaditjirri]